MEAQFLDLYNRELGYLRQLGSEFAEEYPAVAGRLGMDSFSCADPFVERLLEGFAFLAARVHRRLDNEFSQFTGGLLQSIYPHLTRPIPSAAIVSFQPDPDEGSIIDGYTLPAGSRLKGPISSQHPTPCRFDTTQSLTLWPIRIVDAKWVERGAPHHPSMPAAINHSKIRSCLSLTLETTAGLPMSALSLDRLSLHLRGGEVACRLLEMIVAHGQMVVAGDRHHDRWHTLKPSSLTAGGFDDDDALLPQEPRSFSGYRWLQEYFLLPEKFLFTSIDGLSPAVKTASGQQLEILIGFDTYDRDLAAQFRIDHVQLHSVPAVNLFRRRADRIPISDASFEHHLLVDRSRPMDFEIWSVDRLFGHGNAAQEETEFLPLYAPPDQIADNWQHASYYTIDRRPRQPSANQRQYGHRSPYLGSEVYATLTDSGQAPIRQSIRQLSSIVHCTNRDLALLKPASGWKTALQLDGPGPVSKVYCLSGPTRPRPALTDKQGDRCWRLVHHLTTNLLAIDGGQRTVHNERTSTSAAASLREMLSLYCPEDSPSMRQQISGLIDLQTTRATRQLPLPGPIVHGRGTHVELRMDDDAFEGGGSFLLASVIERFLARYTSLNSFVQTSLQTVSRGPVHRWPVRTGTQTLT